MRILKVRLKNLNSLAGEWLVDFQDPAYEQEGRFLITGPTGSGKTTLLDAISLALYGQTPRVSASSRQNEIMTQHADDCLAEVTFETTKGRYRATWMQKRKPDGFAQPKRELADDINKKPLTNNKIKDVQQYINACTGLDFSQFTRAVMLAQGGFSNFLRAKDDDKSAILEKITDTSIYSRLSQLAHEKEKEEREKKETLEVQINDLPILSPEAETEKRALLASYETDLIAARDGYAACGKKIAWLQEIEKIQATGEQLRNEKRDLLVNLQEFEPHRRKLLAAQTAAELEPEFEILNGLRTQARDAAQNLSARENEKNRLAALARECEEKEKQCGNAHATAELELEKAQPELHNARTLDKEILKKHEELAQRQMEAQASAKTLAVKEKQLAAHIKDKEELENAIAQVREWLAANAGDEWLVENLAALKEKIKVWREQWREAGEAEKQSRIIDKDIEVRKAELDKEHRNLDKAQTLARENEAALADLEARRAELLGGWTLEGLRESHQEKMQLKVLAAKVHSLEQERKKLVDDQPCPLCGSVSHPYAEGQLPDIDIIDVQQRELEKQIKEIEGLDENLAAKTKAKDEATLQAQMATERCKGLEENQRLLLSQRKESTLKAANLKKAALAQETEIRKLIEPFLYECPDLNQAGDALEQRRLQWQEQVGKQKEVEARANAIAPALAALEIEVKNLVQETGVRKQLTEISANELATAEAERKSLLKGLPADTEEARLKNSLVQARQTLELARKAKERASSDLAAAMGKAEGLRNQIAELQPGLQAAEAEFVRHLAELGWDESAFAAARKSSEEKRALEAQARKLDAAQTKLETKIDENRKELESARSLELTDKSIPALELELDALKRIQNEIMEARAALHQELRQNQANKDKAAEISAALGRQKQEWQKWQQLDSLIGSADGKKFRAFAQNITLDQLLAHANIQLAKIMDRYALKRRESQGGGKNQTFLDLAIIDNYQAGETRAIENLSGGETFIASLALALGLSEMAGRQTPLGSLFLDEGFGSLDNETLKVAIDALTSLRSQGKLIGIISHVDGLRERIGAKIVVTPGRTGTSEISGPGCRRLN